MKFIILDNETTGLLMPSSAPIEQQPFIIEVGLVVVEDGELVGKHDWLINPGVEISPVITKITGITNEMLVGKPSFSDVLPEIEEVFSGSDGCIAHNAPFDKGVIDCEMKRLGKEFPWPNKVICSVEEYKHMFGRRPRLIELYERVMKKKLEQTHRASDDAMALFEILKEDSFFDFYKKSGS